MPLYIAVIYVLICVHTVGFIDGVLELKSRAAFGGPYYGVDSYVPISPQFVLEETPTGQDLKMDISVIENTLLIFDKYVYYYIYMYLTALRGQVILYSLYMYVYINVLNVEYNHNVHMIVYN